MPDNPQGQIGSRDLQINNKSFRVHYAAYTYPTEFAARQAWERSEKRRHKGDLVSVFRLTDPEQADWLVIAISEHQAPVKTARRLLASGGKQFEPDDDLLTRIFLRRVRVGVEGNPQRRDVMQRARYGRDGALLDSKGHMRPRKRPQG